jgi:hypothetical protein
VIRNDEASPGRQKATSTCFSSLLFVTAHLSSIVRQVLFKALGAFISSPFLPH